MPLLLVFLEDGNLAPLKLTASHNDFLGLLLNSNTTPWMVNPEKLNINYFLSGRQLIVEEELGDANFWNLPLNNVNFCEDGHILIPIDIYTQSKFFGIGIHEFYANFDFFVNDKFLYLRTAILVDVTSGKHKLSNRFLMMLYCSNTICDLLYYL